MPRGRHHAIFGAHSMPVSEHGSMLELWIHSKLGLEDVSKEIVDDGVMPAGAQNTCQQKAGRYSQKNISHEGLPWLFKNNVAQKTQKCSKINFGI